MKPTMAARIRALQDMTVPELRERVREDFGEEPCRGTSRPSLDEVYPDAV